MVKPDQILVQEIRVLPAKSKMTDLVALRHSWAPNHEAKTTLILLCEDGSLRIYNANSQATGKNHLYIPSCEIQEMTKTRIQFFPPYRVNRFP